MLQRPPHFSLTGSADIQEYLQKNPMLVTIEIKLYASLKKYLPDDADRVYPVKAGTPVSVVLEQLNIPKDEARLIFINGVRKDIDAPLSGGDRVGVFPPIGGG